MTRKSVPERTEITCDVCLRVCGDQPGEARRQQNGRLRVDQDALDMHNQPCADASVVRDLCDECLHAIVKAINLAATEARNLVKAKEGATP